MTDKEKADCLIELQKDESQRHKTLVELEFKVNIAIWTLIAISGAVLLKEILPNLCSCNQKKFILIYLLISSATLYFHYLLWLFPISKSQATSNYFIRSYMCQIEELAGFKISSKETNWKPEIYSYWDLSKNYRKWICFEGSFTAFLLIVIFIFSLLVYPR
ncbi:MAG: hypothetical protein JNL57_13155 [Bacteroidetes bacterium]|nr:hypothetical protein [Bacteroidota bacterium]